MTINKVCLSGLTAVIDAARLIRAGEAAVVVAGGQESMTRAPHLLPGSRQGWTYGSIQALDVAAHDGLTDAFDGQSMGLSTETRQPRPRHRPALHRTTWRRSPTSVPRWPPRTERSTTRSSPLASSSGRVTRCRSRRRGRSGPSTRGVPRRASGCLRHRRHHHGGQLLAAVRWRRGAGAVHRGLTPKSHGLEYLAVVGKPGQVAGPDNSLHSQPSNAIMDALGGPAGPQLTSTSSRSTKPSGPWPSSR